MAKAKKEVVPVVSLVSVDPAIPKPRLVKLIVKNYRCIGPKPVEIEINDIVVLVGSNNVGKSSILKAYELAMSQGSANSKLKLEDFPNGKIDQDNLPEIELHTIVYDNSPGERWISVLPTGEKLVKERFIWSSSEDKPKREGWDVNLGGWSDQVPWGAPNVANSRRPEPHRVDAFDPPSVQADEITKILMKALTDRVKNLKTPEPEGENEYQQLLTKVKELQKKIVAETKEQIDGVNQELTSLIGQVFPNYKIDFDAKPEDNLDNTISLFKSGAQLLMGPADGYLSTIDRQGSGARRTLLWTALKFISENNQKMKEEDGVAGRPHVLLIDEPEICLHPTAVRDACKVLYDLPNTGNWQVMVTTHSPIFIDFSRDNTTIIKVERNAGGDIQGTTVFRPDKAQLDDEDKRNLKLLNLCDPYVAEFFFGGKVIIVEGDTEYTAFNYVKAQKPLDYTDIHIIRARGKATIVSVVKILNHFGSSYSVLHDSDTPVIMTKKGKEMASPAWGNNPNILNAVNAKPAGITSRLLASLPNFEQAYFSEFVDTEKPYNALKAISEDPEKFAVVESLLKALIDHNAVIPVNCAQWDSIEDLKIKLDAILN